MVKKNNFRGKNDGEGVGGEEEVEDGDTEEEETNSKERGEEGQVDEGM